ncbi:Flavin-dependent oxidoreductase, luciferase family (includes alkanesulfonate monooxygenase SsuD and methylene tetrahydromethanopterin reductase) [Geodermatophilus saharensis]|uniref:Flavin-dependent oxidoreductase, luciferase family (Includes alkanesulfonate monooxygenase SsuD and methylene tetrahydromethanopterin reductase) n=1 Tax=Geodermatophilus saharensis TaxID=1137994 RepID=A0A239CVV0_9ACTN|nr:LLM class flavin-dependent oxidoreductase [Geodermatophilus saharensis]SNS24197.1 Flavin-dependent oxidoreductase, luciferase family (includes alkanesulfonate monooxygenase SsuD and methylene tetrahydromethanopterin reductase) [Geodermatophilus saharensis]
MEIGIGIPNSVRGTTGAQLLEWARRAEAAGFSSLASIGAVSYPSYEELTVFAAAGAVTERIGFITNVLISPARSTAELAKQASTVQELTGGRLTLGLGAGWRDVDYRLTGRDFASRGRLFDEQLADLHRAWAGEPIVEGTRRVTPETGHDAVPLLIGGNTEAAIRRTVEHGIGWTAGGLPPEMTAPFLDRVRTAWREAGKEGSPRFVALNYFSLGDTEEESRRYLLDYYAPMGRETAEMIAGSAHRSPEAIRDAVAGFAEIGVDELVLDPTVSDPAQVELLAEAAL